MNIKDGDINRGSNWPEPVVVKLIEEIGDFIHIVGATQTSGKHIDQLIPKEEFQKIIVDDKKVSFSEEAWKVFLSLEAVRYRFASMYDPLLAMNTLKVDPLPHQIEAVYDYDMDIVVITEKALNEQEIDYVSDCAWEAGFESGIVVVPVVFSKEEWENSPERYSLLAQAVEAEYQD